MHRLPNNDSSTSHWLAMYIPYPPHYKWPEEINPDRSKKDSLNDKRKISTM
jgi:hypothetical protein